MTSKNIHLDPVRLGPLPIAKHFLNKLESTGAFESHVSSDPRDKISVADTLTILLMNIIIERFPLYKMSAWAKERGILSQEDSQRLNDDRVGRALDRLFKADRAALMTDIVLRAIRVFGLAHIKLVERSKDMFSLSFHKHFAMALDQIVMGLKAYSAQKRRSSGISLKRTAHAIVRDYGDLGRQLIRAIYVDLKALGLIKKDREKSIQNILSEIRAEKNFDSKNRDELFDFLFLDDLESKIEMLRYFIDDAEKNYPFDFFEDK